MFEYKGFSLRDGLYAQGLHTEEDIRKHLNRAYDLVKVVPTIRLDRYKAKGVNLS